MLPDQKVGWEGQAEKAGKIEHKLERITHLDNSILLQGWAAEW